MKTVVEVTPGLLRRRPLPLAAQGDKETRGRLLVVAGSQDVPGAARLAGEAALRAGAGKVTVVTPRSTTLALGMALPETRVLPLAARPASGLLDDLDAAVIGPGMTRPQADLWALAALHHEERYPLLLDAAAIMGLWRAAGKRRPRNAPRFDRCIVTPHAGELAECAGKSKERVQADPLSSAGEAARHLGTLVVLKGPTTVIASPDGTLYRHRATVPGLAMSGSGDVLSGIIGGLLARGASPLDAALWGVFLHARAGKTLARCVGTIGYRALELAAQIPALMVSLGR